MKYIFKMIKKKKKQNKDLLIQSKSNKNELDLTK